MPDLATFVKVLGVKGTATLLAAHPARLQHISRSHAALGLPVLVPICLGGTVPACTSVSPWPDTEGLTQAGSKTLQMTPALQEAVFLWEC